MSKTNEPIETLRWIIRRIEEETDKVLEGKRPNWKKAAIECVEEAYGTLGREGAENDYKT